MEGEIHLFRWYFYKFRENLANIFTALRVLIVTHMFGLFFIGGVNPWLDPRFFWLAIAAALTDLFDGIVARRFARRVGKKTTVFGSNFDKGADKFLEACLFAIIIVMAFAAGHPWLALFFIPIIRTEICLVGAWLYGYRNGKDSKAGYWGKRKMAWFFMLCCVWLMPQNYWSAIISFTGLGFSGYFYACFAAMLLIGSILAEMSFIGYLRKCGEFNIIKS